MWTYLLPVAQACLGVPQVRWALVRLLAPLDRVALHDPNQITIWYELNNFSMRISWKHNLMSYHVRFLLKNKNYNSQAFPSSRASRAPLVSPLHRVRPGRPWPLACPAWSGSLRCRSLCGGPARSAKTRSSSQHTRGFLKNQQKY